MGVVLHSWPCQPQLDYWANASSHSILCYRFPNNLSYVGREPYTELSVPRITNALKTSGKARKSMSAPLNAFSNEMKLNFLEVAFFDELAKDGEVAPAQPRGVTLSTWEDPEDQKS